MAINENFVASALPTRSGEGRNVYQRSDAYGNTSTRPMGKTACNAAEAGAYFVARTPTVNSGVAGVATSAGVSDTQAFLHLYNSASSATGTSLVLDYLKIKVTAAGTNGTTTGFFNKMYSGTSRHSSGGTLLTPVNCNMGSSETASCLLYHGAELLSAANGTERLLTAQNIRSVITVAGDNYWFDFGSAGPSPHNGLVVSGTAISNLLIPCAPVVLGPQCGWQFNMFGASQDAASSFEFELGFYEL